MLEHLQDGSRFKQVGVVLDAPDDAIWPVIPYQI